jgi:hypothetical protein
MFDLHDETYKFYRDHVRLSSEQRKDLAGYRDTNYARLKDGLDKLNFPHPQRKCDQGSYAMYSTNQHPNNNYDIDVAIIFDKEDLPSSPLDARKRIESAMQEGGGNFSKPPEARTNAVTIWYQEGHHVDLAIHRRYFDTWGNEVIEHAGIEWTSRDPMEITNWFNNTVNELSPSKDNGASVANGQMRRVVQLLKMFVKSRSSWQDSGKTLPGGLLISTLVGKECYRSNSESDEKALYDTIVALHNRLQTNIEVNNPVDETQSLTYKDEYKNQVERFKEKLGKALEWLEPLLELEGDKESEAKAWKQFFNHDYWDDLVDQISEAKSLGEALRKTSFATSTGGITSIKPSEKHIEVPSHRYYGDT